ncbi:HotDog domain-containing protein [Microdochium bolleyi]|uniref:HotDog domain-containing protein n=1 Tax=Microdochium bolleyi TaxID=196109 RepID=A0A136IKX8_9PEZI|nr:HotDog domain-containing protein [Microdochium bolleyi]
MVMPKHITVPAYTTFEHAGAFDASRVERADDEAYLRSTFPAVDARLSRPGVRTWAPSTSDVFAITLNNELTLPGFLVYWDEPAGTPLSSTPAQKMAYTPAASHLSDGKAEMVREVHALLRTEKGLQSYPGILQGGMVTALMDEVTGLSTVVNRIRGVEGFREHLFMTASVAVKFAKPVPTPATLVITARIKDVKGRLVMVEGEIRDFDKGGETGPVLARVDAVWAGIKLKDGKPMMFKM